MTASGPGGSIYDLGYQSYTGPRLGRRSAVRALFSQSIRACYGIGRGGRAKIAPFTLAAIAVLPAVLAVGIAAIAAQAGPAGGAIGEASPIRYETYHGLVGVLIMLFCAAQAPELFGRDQRYGVLPLYFSRVLTRPDYALAKVLGLMVALFAVAVAPYLILFVGRVFVAPDPATGLVQRDRCRPEVPAPGRARGRTARRPRLAHRGLDAAPRVRHGDDHRGVHHPADHRRDHRRPDQPGPRPRDRPVQPGRRPRRDERGDLRVDPGQRGRGRGRPARAGRTWRPRSVGIVGSVGLTVRRYLRIAT